MKLCEDIENILQVTKNTVQLSDNFHDYYINQRNDLYVKQLPILTRKNNKTVVSIRNNENENMKNESEDDPEKLVDNKIESVPDSLENIRNPKIRSKKLPPLCPFYSNKGELLRVVVTTSKINHKKFFSENFGSLSPSRNHVKMLNPPNIYANCLTEPSISKTEINFSNFEKDFFYEPEYESLVYQTDEIFCQKEKYIEFIKNKIEELKTIDLNDNIIRKQKIFDQNKTKKHISLAFNSLKVKIYEIDKKNENNEKIEVTEDAPVFEYSLPFSLLPLFYYRGEEKFKKIISKLIYYDGNLNKFNLNENPEKIFKDILKNCIEYNEVLKNEQLKKLNEAKQNSEEVSRSSKKKFSLTVKKNQNKADKNSHKYNINFGSTIADNKGGQGMEQKFMNMYITNIDNKRDLDITKFKIYPNIKETNFLNYNIFEFYWLSENRTFKVFIVSPLIEVIIKTNNIKVKKFIDFELLFYLYQNNFNNWDFYLVKYLSSYKSFRNLLEEINSVNGASNKNFYLKQPKIKYYLYNNIEITNIITVVKKDILENLVQGLGLDNIQEDTNAEQGKDGLMEIGGTAIDVDNNDNEEKKEKSDEFENYVVNQRCFTATVRFIDNKTFKANEFTIFFNFNQFKKFEAIEKYVDKVSFLIKFLDINYANKGVSMNYLGVDDFDEEKWIEDHNHFNAQYLESLESKKENENIGDKQYRTSAEYLGINKNTLIQIEINPPTLLASVVISTGSIINSKIDLNNNFQENIKNTKKDDILELSKVYLNCYQEDQNKK